MGKFLANLNLFVEPDGSLYLKVASSDENEVMRVAQMHRIAHPITVDNVLQLAAQAANLPERIDE